MAATNLRHKIQNGGAREIFQMEIGIHDAQFFYAEKIFPCFQVHFGI